jgi:hypothetical protein
VVSEAVVVIVIEKKQKLSITTTITTTTTKKTPSDHARTYIPKTNRLSGNQSAVGALRKDPPIKVKHSPLITQPNCHGFFLQPNCHEIPRQ